MSEGRRILPAPRLLAAAVLAGALAGGVAVYFSGGMAGNEAESGGAVASAADQACAAKAEHAKALGASAVGEVAAMLPADPPRSVAALAFNGPDGKPMTLADRAGKVVLMNLWATWCAPCRAEMPALDALQKSHGGDGFEVVAVNVDTGDDAKPRKFLAETKVEALAYYRENTLGLFDRLKTEGLALGLPVTLLIGRDGCLLASMNGPAEWASRDAAALIEAALAG